MWGPQAALLCPRRVPPPDLGLCLHLAGRRECKGVCSQLPSHPQGSLLDAFSFILFLDSFLSILVSWSVADLFDAVLGRILKYLLFRWEDHLSGRVCLSSSRLSGLQVTRTQGRLPGAHNLHSHSAGPGFEGSPLGFMLCCHQLEILNNV